MKKSALLVLSLIFAFSLSKPAFSQSTTTMQDIFETVSKKIVDLEETQNQEVVNVTFDLIVSTNKKIVYRFLDPAFAYNVSVIGDRRISKVKISIRKKGDADWEYVDEMSGSNPTLRIEPTAFDQYEFTMSVDEFKAENNTGHFAFLLYHKNPERDH
jgi:hypothetical protein